MDKDQIHRLAQDGLKKRREKGWDPEPINIQAAPVKGGARFTKAQRKQYVAMCELAVASLAQSQYADWYEALLSLREVMKDANFQAIVFEHTCKQIEELAIEASGDKSLMIGARIYLSKRRQRRIIVGAHQ